MPFARQKCLSLFVIDHTFGQQPLHIHAAHPLGAILRGEKCSLVLAKNSTGTLPIGAPWYRCTVAADGRRHWQAALKKSSTSEKRQTGQRGLASGLHPPSELGKWSTLVFYGNHSWGPHVGVVLAQVRTAGGQRCRHCFSRGEKSTGHFGSIFPNSAA